MLLVCSLKVDFPLATRASATVDQTDSSLLSKGVQFKDNAADKPYSMKHVPTQRYDRKEIQKRLDLENWIDD